MKLTLPWHLVFAAVTGLALAAHPATAQPALLTHAERNHRLGVTASAPVDLHVLDANADFALLATNIGGANVTLFLTPHSLRSPDFQLWTTRPDGTLQRVAPPPPHTVRGTVLEWDGNIVVGSLVGGQFTGRVRTVNGADWFIQPLSSIAPGAPRTAHVMIAPADILATGAICGVPDVQPLADPVHEANSVAPDPEGPQHLLGNTFATEIAFDADFDFFQENGSSVAATMDDIESVMVLVDDIYRSQAAISYIVNRIVVRTSEPDPYTVFNHEGLLNQFRSEWENNQPGERDIAHLMTGKDIDGPDGGVVGFAFIAEVCNRDGIINDGAYGFSQSRFSPDMAHRAALTAHELGHNWDASHCASIVNDECPQSFPPSYGIMCACLGGCNGSLTLFGQPSINEVVDHRDSRGCLGTNPAVTFVDDSFVGSETGSLTAPYNTMREGVWASDPNGRVVFFGGTYDADRTLRILNRPLRLEAQPGAGLVRILP